MSPATLDRWHLMALQLADGPLPVLAGPPGRVIVARDEPIPAEYLVGVTKPVELALLLGISPQAAQKRLEKDRRKQTP